LLPLIFLIVLLYTYIDKIENKKWVLRLWMLSFLLAFLWQELGRVVAEVGRQPWTVQDMLPTKMSTSHLSVRSVKLTFFLFLVIFTALIIAEFTIMIRAIKDWPKIEEK
jgi:cytochrome d ubiquinol oxidase subunit I